MKQRAWRGWCVLIPVVLAVGCEEGSTTQPSSELTESQRTAIVSQILASILSGLLPAGPLGGRSAMLLEARRTLGPLPGSLGSLNCSLTCASPCALSCPFSGTYPCSRGGSITNTSTITGQVEPDLTGDADIVGKQTYADCSPEQSLVINGDPYTTLNGKLKFKTAQLYGNQTGHIGGAVKYVSGNLSGSCPIDVNLTYSTITSKATVTGTACGAPVNMTY